MIIINVYDISMTDLKAVTLFFPFFLFIDPSEHYEYAVACPPTHRPEYPSYSGCAVSIVSEYTMAMVNISTVNSQWTQAVSPGIPQTINFNQTVHTTCGLEDKAIMLVSETELVVLLHKLDSTSSEIFLDATQVYDLQMAGFEYYILNTRSGCSSSSYINAFYMIMSHWPATFLQVYESDVFVEAQVLTHHQVYTTYTTSISVDFSGRYIHSNYPVTIIAGTLCVGNLDSDYSGTYMTSLPPIIHYGEDYAAPSIASPIATGYRLDVVAAEDDTRVTFEGENVDLDKGETSSIEFLWNNLASMVTCSKKCLLIQYSVSTLGLINGDFMINVIPTEQFYKYSYFSTIDYDVQHYVSIMVHGLPPMDDIFLDGTPLNDETWRFRDKYTYIDLPVERGQHTIRVHSRGKNLRCLRLLSHLLNKRHTRRSIWLCHLATR